MFAPACFDPGVETRQFLNLNRAILAGSVAAWLALAGCSNSAPVNADASSSPGIEWATHKPAAIAGSEVPAAPVARGDVSLKLLGRHRHGTFKQSAAEICAYHPASRRLFVVNAEQQAIDILDVSDPASIQSVAKVQLAEFGGKPNSVAVHGELIAIAISASPLQNPGAVAFLSPDGEVLKRLEVGPQPDMLTFSPDGRWLLTANEGEPSDDYTNDPPGSVSLIDLTDRLTDLSQQHVTTLGFEAFNDRTKLDPSIRVYGPNATVAMDLEPEYIAVAPDSQTAWVALQEANALAIIDLEQRVITKLVGLGFKDHSRPENAFDANDKDGGIRIQMWPVFGMYQPDAIRAWTHAGETFLISANEGDHRKYGAFNEEANIGKLKLDPQAFPQAEKLAQPDQLGRLLVTNAQGDADGDGDFDRLYCLGGRSFSIWSAVGELVFDSGSEFERIIAAKYPSSFNADQITNGADERSDNKGPEPEGVALAELGDRRYAFIGLERHSGIMIYDVTDPTRPEFVNYELTRDFGQPAETEAAGDLGPEGLIFIPAEQSPNGRPLLAVSFEVSGTTAIFEVVTDQK